MIDVPEVVVEFLFPGEGVAAVDLGPAGEAGAGEVTAGLGGGVVGEVFGEEGAGADEAHVAFEDVPEFGEFVEGGGAEEAAEGGGAEGVGAGAGGHGAEFAEGEEGAVFAGAGLAEEDGGAEAEADEEGEEEEQGGEEEEEDGGAEGVEESLKRVI